MYEDIKERFLDLEQKMMDSSSLKDQKEIIKLSREHASLKKAVGLISDWEKASLELKENKEIINSENDQDLKDMAESEIGALEEKITR